MTSFTSASGPLEDVLRARAWLVDAAEDMRRVTACIEDACAALWDAAEGLQELDQLILGRTTEEENR